MGYATTAHRRAGEQLMQAYFLAAKVITQLNTILLQNIGAEIFPVKTSDAEVIDEKFSRIGELLDARRSDLFERDPGAILESFLVMQQHSELQGMTARTLRALWRARGRHRAALPRGPHQRRPFPPPPSAPPPKTPDLPRR